MALDIGLDRFERAVRRAERTQVVSEVLDALAVAWGSIERGGDASVAFKRLLDDVQAVSRDD